MNLKTRLLWTIASVLSGCSLLEVQPPAPPPTNNDKFLTFAGTNAEVVDGSYFVTFNDDLVPEASVSLLSGSIAAGSGATIKHVFTKTVRGFAVEGANDAWAIAVSRRPDVDAVRKDIRVYGKELRGSPADPVPWNLDRIDQRASLTQDRDLRFKTGPVDSLPRVPIYILDNGIYRDHSEFADGAGSRVIDVADVMGTRFARCALALPNASHGTSIASIAAGNKFGVTPTTIINVKVLDRGPFGDTCTAGTATSVAAGLEATFAHMQSSGSSRAVVNLSLGWSVAVPDVATQILRLQGIGAVIVAAAGNENVDAAGVAPANLPNVVAVGATTQADARHVVTTANGSNFGRTVSLWAPGASIKAAAWPAAGSNPAAFDVFSGTSMAAPHVAGALALLWQQDPTLTPTQVAAALRARATRNMLTGLGAGSDNALLYVGEAAPRLNATRVVPKSSSDGGLNAVLLNSDRSHVLLAGGSPQGPDPLAFASIAANNPAGAPIRAGSAGSLALSECGSISDSGRLSYFGCSQLVNGVRQSVVVATDTADPSRIAWQTRLGPDTSINSLIYGYAFVGLGRINERVFALVTRPRAAPSVGTEVLVVAMDVETGQQLGSVVLSAVGFSEQFHRGAGIVLIETVTSTSTDLVVATLSDPPGPDKTFLWRLDPTRLQILDSREVPAPALALNGHFATSLAVQIREDNGGGIVIPGEIYLATTATVSTGIGSAPSAFIHRLNADRVTVQGVVEVVRDAVVNTLWSVDGDLYFCGSTTRTFLGGSLSGTPKPGTSPDFDAFIGKSEGVTNTRRWMAPINAASLANDRGVCTYDLRKAYVVTDNPTESSLVELLVY